MTDTQPSPATTTTLYAVSNQTADTVIIYDGEKHEYDATFGPGISKDYPGGGPYFPWVDDQSQMGKALSVYVGSGGTFLGYFFQSGDYIYFSNKDYYSKQRATPDANIGVTKLLLIGLDTNMDIKMYLRTFRQPDPR